MGNTKSKVGAPGTHFLDSSTNNKMKSTLREKRLLPAAEARLFVTLYGTAPLRSSHAPIRTTKAQRLARKS
jgi:hypothetical protein